MRKITLVFLLIALCLHLGMMAKKPKSEKRKMSITEMIDSIKWDSPTRETDSSYTNLNSMYDCADSFYTFIQSMPDSIPLYEIRRIYNAKKGDTILAPVNIRTGEMRTSLDATNQSLAGVTYALESMTWTLKLTGWMAANAVQIAVDATPLGSKERRKANKQITHFLRIFPIITKTLKEQSHLMKAYKAQNESLSADDGPVTSLPGVDLTSDVVMDMSDEEIAAWFEAESANRS